jgi:hypothetical protein
MRQFITIATNAFMELARQPVFLLLMTTSAVFEIFLATPFYFAFGDEPKLVKNSTLAVMLLAGLLGAVLSASASLAREIRTGTALAVLSKPVGRAQFLVAKYAGLVMALTMLTYVNLIAVLLASRMAFDAYGSTDMFALGVFALSLVVAYGLGGFSNFFLRRPFVSDAAFSLLVMVTVAFVVINCFDQHGKPRAFATGVDWRLIPAAVLILFALWILAGLALACSTRFDIIPTLAICSTLFLPAGHAGLAARFYGGTPQCALVGGPKGVAAGNDREIRQGPQRRARCRRAAHRGGGQGAHAGGGHGRSLVGFRALHRDAELAAFLAGGCVG